ncbi:MAG TPA: class I SAM-dependent methyltransferase [Polyangiales bacterium]|nr:class I SAM-dependent methyltransferase [Polyangiales bacterium]
MAVVFPSLNSSEVWDDEYARGHWERIHNESEFGCYALILAHLWRKGRSPSVLDVGCGEGRLLSIMNGFARSEYVGVDLSTEAIQRARALDVPDASFAVAWAEHFEAERRFDVIVFNESLYDLPSPEQVVARYRSMLAPDGMIVISMFRCFSARLIWRKIARKFPFTHQERVTNQLGHAWDVRVI